MRTSTLSLSSSRRILLVLVFSAVAFLSLSSHHASLSANAAFLVAQRTSSRLGVSSSKTYQRHGNYCFLPPVAFSSSQKRTLSTRDDSAVVVWNKNSWDDEDDDIDNDDDDEEQEEDNVDENDATAPKLKQIEKAWRHAKKTLLRIGEKGVSKSHGNSLKELLNAHTVVKVKINTEKLGTLEEAFDVLRNLAQDAGEEEEMELIHVRPSEKTIMFGRAGTLNEIANGSFPPPPKPKKTEVN